MFVYGGLYTCILCRYDVGQKKLNVGLESDLRCVYFQGTQIELSIGVILGISTMAGTIPLVSFIRGRGLSGVFNAALT